MLMMLIGKAKAAANEATDSDETVLVKTYSLLVIHPSGAGLPSASILVIPDRPT